MVYHLSKSIFYLFFLFIPPVFASMEVNRLNQEMNFLKKHASDPFLFLPEDETTDQVSTKQAALKKTEKKVDLDSMLSELEEETGPFKPSPPHYTN
jgi:hypothetical protein